MTVLDCKLKRETCQKGLFYGSRLFCLLRTVVLRGVGSFCGTNERQPKPRIDN